MPFLFRYPWFPLAPVVAFTYPGTSLPAQAAINCSLRAWARKGCRQRPLPGGRPLIPSLRYHSFSSTATNLAAVNAPVDLFYPPHHDGRAVPLSQGNVFVPIA